MGELEEFADALLDQIAVEINEEKEIATLASRIAEDREFDQKFDSPKQITEKILDETKKKILEFTGLAVPPEVKIEHADLEELKNIKGRKVFATPDSQKYVEGLFAALAKEDRGAIVELIKEDTVKFLVYSTYAKSYISKITTTYGEYLDSAIFINNFVLSSYPQIILYKSGKPYHVRYDMVNSGYSGALKMTLLEELIHSVQENLYKENKKAVIEVNAINEELAKIILELDDSTASQLAEYLQLPPVPEEFPLAKRANLFFTLNPDTFIVNVLGPDVMTFTKVEIDPTISKLVPKLLDIYQRWLAPIQRHHAAFTTMEGMAEFCVQNILKDDIDFARYLTMFMGTDITTYQFRKSMGKDFVQAIYAKKGKDAFAFLIQNPPTTRELKDPQLYLTRTSKNQ